MSRKLNIYINMIDDGKLEFLGFEGVAWVWEIWIIAN